jgi:hypothetical protein
MAGEDHTKAASSSGAGGSNGGSAVATVGSDVAVHLALEIGWTVAVLYGHLISRSGTSLNRLPTEHELEPVQRIELEVERLDSLLNQLSAQPLAASHRLPAVPRTADLDETERSQTLLKFNLEMLEALAQMGRAIELAYQLGRSLRDTVHPPLRADLQSAGQPSGALNDSATTQGPRIDPAVAAIRSQFSRGRVFKLQSWLIVLGPQLPKDSAAIVGTSLGHWCDFTWSVFDSSSPERTRLKSDEPEVAFANVILSSLLNQGDVWLNLLIGVQSPGGFLTPEGYVAAGEAALHRTAKIIRRIALHYWFALLVLAAALVVIFYIAARDLGGAAKLWTQTGAIAGSLGITAKGIGNKLSSLANEAESPIYGLEKIDVEAWAVTSLPRSVKLNSQGVRLLRRNGILGPRTLGRN